jgi:hypothetical protein
MQYISALDYVLFPLYFILIYLLVKSRSVKYRENGLYKYYMLAFFLHMVGAFLYAMVIQYYYGYGDSFGFFRGSNFLSTLSKDEATLKYFFYSPEDLSNLFLSSETGDNVIGAVMSNASNLMIIKISAAISLFCFDKYLVITLFFGFFAFAGLWRLFVTFNEILENKAQKLLAITVLCTPSIWFWGSGIIKDSICIGCLGFVVSFLYKIFIKKNIRLTDILLLALFFYTLFVVKSYIAAALIIAVVFFAVHFFVVSRKSVIEKWIFSIVILLASVLIFNFVLQAYIRTIIEDAATVIDKFKNAYDSFDNAGDTGSGFTSQSVNFTASGILLRSPFTIFTTLYRPFLWEIRNLMMLFSSLESFVALLVFVYLLFKLKLNFFSYILGNPFTLFAFVIVIILSLIIGFTTFNFGTMVRYRIPIFPFYAFLLTSIYIKYKAASSTPAPQ